MIFSCHNHSTWSDGTASIREMAEAARAAGVTVFGISDHLVLSPYVIVDWSLAVEKFHDYCAEAKALKRELSGDGFEMRVGVEADYFPETVDELKALVAAGQLDYVIGAIHYAGPFPIDHQRSDWEGLSEAQCHRVWEIYLEKLHGMAAVRGIWSWIAHLDLPKKFGFPLPGDLRDEMARCLHEIADAGLAIELNLAGLDKPCAEAYPAPEWLQLAKRLSIPIVTSADGHATSQITRHYDLLPQLL